MGFGTYYLWTNPWGFWVWWVITLSMTLGMLLAWHWQNKEQLLKLDFAPSVHWTDRDKEAWKVVEAWARRNEHVNIDKLANIGFYVETGQSLALELARF